MADPDFVQYVRSILAYSPETGVFTWAKDRFGGVKAGVVAGGKHKDGYLDVRLAAYRKRHLLHRLAFVIMNGEWPQGQVDHVNGIRDDNRWVNLVDSSKAENMRNRCLGRHNKSGVMGVHWSNTSHRWVARIDRDKVKYGLGSFTDFFEAVCARKSAENQLGYPTNHGRKHERFGRNKTA